MKYWGWPIYFMVVFVLFSIAFFVNTDLQTRVLLNKFISDNSNIIWSVGTLFFVAVLTLVTTGVANSSTDIQKKADRFVSAEIEISKFRQTWINSLRDIIAEIVQQSTLLSLAQEKKSRDNCTEKLMFLEAKLELMLNPIEIPAQKILTLAKSVIANAQKVNLGNASHNSSEEDLSEKKITKEQFDVERQQLAKQSAEYIKSEWNVVKTVLKSAKQYWS